MKKFYLVLLSLFFFFNISFSQNVPEWAKGIVWYQIFPERFANGDSTNDPSPEKVYAGRKSPEDWKIRKWTSNWFEKDVWEEKLGDPLQNHLYERRYGGDLQGIIDKLDYLKELGVKAIYFNPIFESISLHKYDASYYHHIDVEFGPSPKIDKQIINSENPEDKSTWKWTTADSLFLKLVDEVHKRGMRIVLDGVFNHVGTQFWAFKDLREKQEKSKYKDWFIVNEFDDPKTEKNEFEYKGWWGYWGMPEFNRTKENLNPEPSKYIFNSTNKWMDPNGDGNPSDGIDGWRLDVARDVPLGFWKDWSALVKKTNKNAIIIGELWELSPDFIAKDGPFDALMNYNFAFAVNDFFLAEKKKIDTEEFVERLQEIDNTYPADNLYVLQNLIDSHDTDRLLSIAKNPDRKYDGDGKEENTKYDPSAPTEKEILKQKLVLAFQMTYLGSPMIYYGDEVGMWGADDPHCRKPMIWDNLKYDNEVIDENSGFKVGYGSYPVEQNKDVLNFYKKLIKIHNENPALQKGTLKFIYIDNNQPAFAFERNLGGERVYVLFNLSKEKVLFKIPVGAYENLLLNEEMSTSGNINLEPESFMILKSS